MKRAILIDTDTASDDAVALIMALRAPGVRVIGITTMARQCRGLQSNKKRTLCSRPLPQRCTRIPGSGKAFVARVDNRRMVPRHGRSGDRGYPAPERAPQKTHAVDPLIAAVNAHPGLTVVALGPLTNIVLGLAKAPTIAAKVGRCVVMGGNPACEGNVTREWRRCAGRSTPHGGRRRLVAR